MLFYFYMVDEQEQNEFVFDNLGVGILLLLLIDVEGCICMDSVVVVIDCFIYVFLVFFFNGDGCNDCFEFFFGLFFFVVQYQIFDCWGGLFYEVFGFGLEDRAVYWDGIVVGELLNIGLYIYYIEVFDSEGEVVMLKGGIMLV